MYDSPYDLLLAPPSGPLIAALWGALWGSFLNVVIERLPRGESLMRPASHCLGCGTPIRFYDNIPILSYLLLRGRCRHCGARFSPRYLLVEGLGLVLSLLCFHHSVTTGTGSVAVRLAQFLVEFYFSLGLLAILFIDIRTMIIPDAITLPMLAVLPAAAIALRRVRWLDALIGAAVGFGVVWLLREIWLRLRGEEGIGLGDGKLLAVVAGVLGWRSLPIVLLLGSIQGLLVALPLRWLGHSALARESYQGTAVRAAEPTAAAGNGGGGEDGDDAQGEDGDDAQDEDESLVYDEIRADAVPFGPFLALAAIEFLFLGDAIQRFLAGFLDGALF